jgi:hypothetical protein
MSSKFRSLIEVVFPNLIEGSEIREIKPCVTCINVDEDLGLHSDEQSTVTDDVDIHSEEITFVNVPFEDNVNFVRLSEGYHYFRLQVFDTLNDLRTFFAATFHYAANSDTVIASLIEDILHNPKQDDSSDDDDKHVSYIDSLCHKFEQYLLAHEHILKFLDSLLDSTVIKAALKTINLIKIKSGYYNGEPVEADIYFVNDGHCTTKKFIPILTPVYTDEDMYQDRTKEYLINASWRGNPDAIFPIPNPKAICDDPNEEEPTFGDLDDSELKITIDRPKVKTFTYLNEKLHLTIIDKFLYGNSKPIDILSVFKFLILTDVPDDFLHTLAINSDFDNDIFNDWDVRSDLHSHGHVKHCNPCITQATLLTNYLYPINGCTAVTRNIVYSNALFNNLNSSRIISPNLKTANAISQINSAVNSSCTINIPRNFSLIGQNIFDNTAEVLRHTYFMQKMDHRFETMVQNTI